ncbi:hypothetical protein BHE74_00056979 [Ensete ventricosum]|nr:hypothetical protein GW17_00033263 [Ensete ventricosum]RWW37844.1 hypothetical protein BHE74_00056979 [Ensete ventricosum]RZS12736.1 hypothetical protein BHM03_00044225 [Ensete ventricosum]
MRRSLGDVAEASSSPRRLRRGENYSEAVVASPLEGNAVLTFSSSTTSEKDEGCNRLRPSVKNTAKKPSCRLAIRGRRRPEVLPLSLSSSFSLIASSSFVVAKLISPDSEQ